MSAVAGDADRPADAAPAGRIVSVDLLRGAVMVLMAIDHVRVYSGLPAGGPTPGIFFTRWVTHFCAPAFVFLAGTSAYLYARRHADVARLLVTRGLWLVLLELTVVRVAWTFNLGFARYEMAGVLWAIGWSMVALALLSRLPLGAVAAIGLAIIAGHNLLDAPVQALVPTLGNDLRGALWRIAYVGFFAGPISAGEHGPNLIVLYALVPWIGVMAAGWAFGAVLRMAPERRDRVCLTIGLAAVLLFLALRGGDLYGDPRHWRAMTVQRPGGPPPMPALLAFLNTTKYPASLSFLLMTLGPTIALVPFLERARGAAAGVIATFGRVPFFYYLLHIPLIHVLALAVSYFRLGEVSPWLFLDHPMGNPPPPEGYAWGLPLLYLVFVVAVALLYLPCRWWAGLKARRTERWLAYL